MKKLLLISFLMIAISCYGQKPMTVKDYKKAGRDSLIELALQTIRKDLDSGFTVAGFRTRVFASKEKIRVEFNMPIQFLPQKGSYIYNLSVSFPGGSLSCSSFSLGGDTGDPLVFRHTKATRSAMDFIFKSINTSTEIGHVKEEEWPEGSTMQIREVEDHYEIDVSSESTHSFYKIKKESGEVYDAYHKHYAREMGEKEKEEEILK